MPASPPDRSTPGESREFLIGQLSRRLASRVVGRFVLVGWDLRVRAPRCARQQTLRASVDCVAGTVDRARAGAVSPAGVLGPIAKAAAALLAMDYFSPVKRC